ncbi:MAG: metallophosphoesterase [Bacteroidota bacterium]
MKCQLLTCFILWILLMACSTKEPLLTIGLVADPQYADKPTAGKRYYGESLWKLEEAIDTFNHYQVDFVQTLGDVIDVKWESFDAVLPIYEQLDPGIESYQLLGNHDFDVDAKRFGELLGKLDMPDYYYSYAKQGWRFIVLDATDYAYYSYLLHGHDTTEVNRYYAYADGKPNQQRWNGAIGEAQQNWLAQQLDSATMLDQKVILFSHLPLRPLDDPHNLWNNEQILKLIEGRPNVVAYINGHNHAGAYEVKDGIHYLTMFGMVDTEDSSYGILEIYQDRLVLKGYGNQESLMMVLGG